MLGQLINSLNPGKRLSQRLPQLDSDIEEAHTKSLLFPDAAALHVTSALSDLLPGDVSASTASLVAGIDTGLSDLPLESPRDIRIIVAQNAKWSQEETVLFDSWQNQRLDPLVSVLASTTSYKAIGTAPSSRRSSIASQDAGRRSPSSPAGGSAFQRHKHRNISISTPLPFIDETPQARQREAQDMVKQALECMFENAQSSYKGTSTRIHTIPLEAKTHETVLTSPTFAESSSSLGKAAGQRRSLLAKSYTPNDAATFQQYADDLRTPRTPGTEARKRTVLISRMFPVLLPDAELEGKQKVKQEPPSTVNEHNTRVDNLDIRTSPATKRRSQPRSEKRQVLPMYGISIIMQLPLAGGHGAPRRNRSGYFPTMPSGAGGDSFSSSLGSEDRAGGWSFVDSVFGVESLLSNSFSSDVDDRFDLIGQHWDIVSRALTSLQISAQNAISAVLSAQLSSASRLQLVAYALAGNAKLHNAADAAARRIVRGIKLPRVRTGQQRWGIWREEARWVVRWAGRQEETEFLYTVLTTFLGKHTDWMRSFGPKWHRKRHARQQHQTSKDDVVIPQRFLIIASPETKMAVRRIIFLLATFLPPNKPVQEAHTPMRPETAASLRNYSRSPPGGSNVSRQQSLRRTINLRGNIPSSSRAKSSNTTSARDSEDNLDSDEVAITDQDVGADVSTRSRRESDARSILRVPVNVSNEDDNLLRKSSTTTISTITPDLAPAAHFAIQRANSATDFRFSHHRPGSSGSLASANLLSALQRDNTGSSTSSQVAPSRWGSLKSLWSVGSRQDSSTDYSDAMQATDEGFGILSLASPRLQQSRSSNKLEQMVREAEASSGAGLQGSMLGNTSLRRMERSSREAEVIAQPAFTPPTKSQPIPDRTSTGGSPFKMSISEKDGVIDVEIPFHDLGVSPPTASRSPFSPQRANQTYGTGHHHSSSFASTASNSPRFSFPPSLMQSYANLLSIGQPFLNVVGLDDGRPQNIGGCLSEFHPDFTLQAILVAPPIYHDDKEWLKEVKAAMKMEPNPPHPASPLEHASETNERWIDVAQTVIADTRIWAVKSLSLRRLVRYPMGPPRLKPNPNSTSAITTEHAEGEPTAAAPSPRKSRYGNPYDRLLSERLGTIDDQSTLSYPKEIVVREEWHEETIQDADEMLVEAFERAIGNDVPRSTPVAINTPASRTPLHSRAPSISSSQGSSKRGHIEVAPMSSSTHSEASQPRTAMQRGLPVSGPARDGLRECKDVMFGFLEAIVKDVVGERQAQGQAAEHGTGRQYDRGQHSKQSGLRQGILQWLEEVEQGAKGV